MRLVILETPFAGDRGRHLRFARACLKDCLDRGEAPLASHLLYTQVLDDDVVGDRKLGVAAGLAWAERADATVVYENLGISSGMTLGIEHAERIGRPVERRRLPGKW